MSRKLILGILLMLLLVGGLILGIYLVQRQQRLKSKANLDISRIEFIGPNVFNSVATSRDVKLKLIYVASASGQAQIGTTPTASSSSTLPLSPTPATISCPTPPACLGTLIHGDPPAGFQCGTWICSSNQASSSATASGNIQGISIAKAQTLTPTHFRLANSEVGVPFAVEKEFDQNEKEIDWRLSEGNGQKTVYLQFKIGSVWQDPISAAITLNQQQIPNNINYGLQVDVRDQQKIPTSSQIDTLKPTWVRFVYPCVDAGAQACPNDYHKTNLMNNLPGSLKRLAVVNGETAWGAPVGSTNDLEWANYFKNSFLPVIKKVASDSANRIDALELWNEEDHNTDPNYKPYIPPYPYAQMVLKAASAIRSINPKIDVIIGGLVGNYSYIVSLKNALPEVFDDIDGIGIHPYVIPDDHLQINTILQTLRQVNLQNAINKPLWVTEIGIQDFPAHQTYPRNQREFLESAFNQFVALNTKPQLVSWYAYVDSMSGGDGSNTWGLYRTDGAIKSVGEAYKNYTATASAVIATPAPPVATSSATPAPIKTPSPAPVLKIFPPAPGKKLDLNGDGKVNSLDLGSMYNEWRKPPKSRLIDIDFNGDGVVNTFDYFILRSNFTN